jgi:uncharacterized phage protein (TIGR01671 family)
MNRELKFRVWDVRLKHFVAMFESIFLNRPEEYLVTQNTGIKDKNGKEIYEGDILSLPDTNTDPIMDGGSGPMTDFNHLAEVVFENASFGVQLTEHGNALCKGFYSFDMLADHMGFGYVGKECEVIGTVYENPELLHR